MPTRQAMLPACGHPISQLASRLCHVTAELAGLASRLLGSGFCRGPLSRPGWKAPGERGHVAASLHRASGSWRVVTLGRSCCARSLLTGSAMSRDGLVTGELAPVLSSYLDDGHTSSDVVSAREQAAV